MKEPTEKQIAAVIRKIIKAVAAEEGLQVGFQDLAPIYKKRWRAVARWHLMHKEDK